MEISLGGFTGLLLFGLLAAGANVVGGLVLIKSGAHRLGERFLKYLVALGAGFMLAAIFIEIVPETIGIWTQKLGGDSAARSVVGAMTLLLAGYLLIQLFEHTLAPHFHFGAETHPESMLRPSAAYTAVGGLCIHTFFDGVSIASAFLVNFKVGVLIFIAILLHKMPEGFTVASSRSCVRTFDSESADRNCSSWRCYPRGRCRCSIGEYPNEQRGWLRTPLFCRRNALRRRERSNP
jgi:zinc transporter ZupT